MEYKIGGNVAASLQLQVKGGGASAENLQADDTYLVEHIAGSPFALLVHPAATCASHR